MHVICISLHDSGIEPHDLHSLTCLNVALRLDMVLSANSIPDTPLAVAFLLQPLALGMMTTTKMATDSNTYPVGDVVLGYK